ARRAVDGDLLPAVVREQKAASCPGGVLPGARGGGAGRVPSLPALSPGGGEPRGSAHRAGPLGLPADRCPSRRTRESGDAERERRHHAASLAARLPRGARRHPPAVSRRAPPRPDRKSTRLNSSHVAISYAVFCLKKKYIKQPILDRLPHVNR